MGNIKKEDKVKILAGKDKDKTGKVLKVFPDEGRVVVEGINLYKKHVRPKKEGEKGEIVDVPRPIDESNVSVICPACSKTTRISKKRKGKDVVRYCKKCDSPID
ncbi:MAG TPA: 50S ribosomal protein L24 [Candidatus Paceibacterota bacterium]|nr:50S ribosomal protein L24 [Candidatus Paceibacterota bacterium]